METAIQDADPTASLTGEVKEYASQFLSLSKSSTENTVAMCEVLYKAKQQLQSNDFASLQQAIGYGSEASSKTIIKYLKIGEHADRFRPYLERLPNTWTTLYQITQLPEDKFIEACAKGLISPSSRGVDIKVIADGTTNPVEPTPTINLRLGESFEQQKLQSFLQELEAMRLDYSFTLETNSTLNKLLKAD